MIVHNINSPWLIESDYDSHRPLLWLAAEKMLGSIVEFGSGFGSTPLLKEYCKQKDREFLSFETDPDWAEKFEGTNVIGNYKELYFDGIEIGILFIDGKPGEERKDLIKLFSNSASVIVTHDTEIGAEYVYGMSSVLSEFKYRLDLSIPGMPQTTAVSNFIDVSKWVE